MASLWILFPSEFLLLSSAVGLQRIYAATSGRSFKLPVATQHDRARFGQRVEVKLREVPRSQQGFQGSAIGLVNRLFRFCHLGKQ